MDVFEIDKDVVYRRRQIGNDGRHRICRCDLLDADVAFVGPTCQFSSGATDGGTLKKRGSMGKFGNEKGENFNHG
jgi:hypothetical protein